ncbi:MAG: D-alanine--D-alanine ligase family protein [Bacteroidota bacterium]
MKNIIIFHSPLPENAPADELDVLQEAEFFQKGLLALGYAVSAMPFPYNLQTLERVLHEQKPEFVVNLVETVFGSGQLVHLGPFMFEHFRLRYTGCSAHAMYLSSHKIFSKQFMHANGIPTPVFFTFTGLQQTKDELIQKPFLIKSLWEHASFGMDESRQLLFSTRQELLERFEEETRPEDFFCEEYIHGREFNLSVLQGENGAEVLPPAEIRFEYPDGKPRILGYKAKWEEDSFEYRHTVRTFEFSTDDLPLLNQLKSIALQCWEVFGLVGYARVDFRVDEKGRIYVLEINANPCISDDSGFVATARRAGLADTEVVKRIIARLS